LRAVRRLALAAALLALGLAGCPIPQPLPDYPAGTIEPPRIRMDHMVPETDGNPIIFVPANCVTVAPSYTLGGSISDANTFESVEARWFVNYDPRYPAYFNYLNPWSGTIPPNADTTNLIRSVPNFTFEPYNYGGPPGPEAQTSANWADPGILRVVELVVSNGFDPTPITTPYDLPNKKPLTSTTKTFETQTYRWVFLSVPDTLHGGQVRCP
jgi:hypothetical protein